MSDHEHECGTSRRLRSMLKDRDAKLAEARRLLQEAQDRGLEDGSEWAEEVDCFLAGWVRRPEGVFPLWEPADKGTGVI